MRAAPRGTNTVRPRSVKIKRFQAERAATLVPTFGVFWLLAFCFVAFSQKLPLGPVAGAAAIVAAALRGKEFAVPPFYRWYLGYIAIGAMGWFTTRYPSVVSEELFEGVKIALLGIAAWNVIYTPRSARTFVVWYLALFALYPVRGALYNYVHGFTEFGRIAWNFYFRNPNDLAMTCFLPLGLCGYVIFVEKGRWLRWSAWIGVVVITGVQMLTQSRGAMLSLGAGILYFAMHTKRRVRALLVIGALCAVAVAATPSHVWDRLAGLSNLSSEDLSKVDPEHSAAGRVTLMRLAWHLGNRHLPTEIRNQVLRIRPDHVIEDMLRGFGADLVLVQAAFQPEGGAYTRHGHPHQHDDRGHHHER